MTIQINRVYTRGGDKGKTSLVGGQRVDKDSLKLDCYGTVDELICFVGMARTLLSTKKNGLPKKTVTELEKSLKQIQNKLFDIGSILATPAGETYPTMPKILDADSTALEKSMDEMQKSLSSLTSFVLPGGTELNASLHQCRAICRRTERLIVGLAKKEKVNPSLIKYVNRLSDFLFVMSRYVSKKAGVKEYLWEYEKI